MSWSASVIEEWKRPAGFRSGSRALGLVLTTAFKASPGLTIVGLCLVPLGQLTPQAAAIWLKLFADGAVRSDPTLITIAVIGSAVSAGIFFTWIGIGSRIRWTLSERVSFALERRLTSLVAGLPRLEHHERPDYLDRMELLRLSQMELGGSLNALISHIALLFQVVLTLGLLAQLHPALLILPVFSIPAIVAATAAQRRYIQAEERTVEHWRRSDHLHNVAVSREAGKELRVFNLEREILRRRRQEWSHVYRETLRAYWVTGLWRAGAQAFFTVGFIGAVTFVAVRAARGLASPGDVLMALVLAGQVNQVMSGLGGGAMWLRQTLRMGSRLLWLIDYARDQEPERELQPAPGRLREGVAFEGVSFRYPGTDEWVLRDVNLNLPAGSVVAVVGENGAGKTTIVKLLCQFYDPTEGRITIDGCDLREIDHADWRRMIAGGFQDFMRFELVAGETVGIGELPRLDDHDAIAIALERAGAADVPAELRAGLQTQLGRQWDGGMELSFGQWQKLALGRALMRDGPLLLLLDEPTAALDAQTEHVLFERFAGAASAAGKRGAITVLVSHRFSTVRMADLIVVIADGRVVDAGSHAELMAHGGLYSDLYTIQARAYS